MSVSLQEIVIFLAAAVISVPIAQRLKLGSVLGYLLAGMIIGPWGLGLIGQVDEVLHLAEFGVVFLLFIIGLEMQPRRLWALRKAIIGLGGLQVLATGVALAVAAAWVMDLPPAPAAVAGAALALSSTAFALQMLAERGELTSRHGRGAFAILLFQDLAVIPILALLPLLSVGHAEISLLGGLEKTAKAAGVIGVLVIGGHYVLKPVLRLVAATRMQEIFIATALLIVVGTAAIMEAAGISVALGAFVAGVLLADSEYRHELEANVDPFKDLLLGLFFIAVGMSINLGLFASVPLKLIEMTAGLFAVKALILFGLARRHGLKGPAARNLAAYLGQGGEFAFVILSTAVAGHLFVQAEADLLVATVTLSMVITPLAVQGAALFNRWRAGEVAAPDYETPEESEHPVIIAGFGRVGGIVARMLRAKRIGFIALEANPAQVDFVRRFGARVYYGDAARLEMLRAAHAEEAKVLVVAIGEMETSLRLIHMVRTHFPHLHIVARARDRRHAYRLLDEGVTVFQRETFLSSIALAGDTMRALGLSRDEVDKAQKTFRAHDEARLSEHYEVADDEERLARRAREAAAELEALFERDEAEKSADEAR
ncbi:monovalent cation:proton antiporter-2 (CPA2) family protein [Salinisphaera sp. Q1T1-3]|uniref:monovalent cation:proton antiporter-2 (CPA2) family protein n=1 Tax=Salinisphaera sp. Q1T1-3 TaxID=2321229 RepID=UPI000E72656D|nr:monovalent cation:proton antiporter-2 (CPA2) family protein [Salinisphaera sp. Q1T1-3]RJS93305.1 glutathione-regulated potassium-efflux system protein KefB [Salinisphaera sp. Q1T1-3]